MTEKAGARRTRPRMSGAQRQEQLIVVSRGLFAERGLEGTSVEEIAQAADVSKPVVYEHFGGKENLYAAVVQRESAALASALMAAVTEPWDTYRDIIYRATMALLNYMDASPEGFRILSRNSSEARDSSTRFASILDDITDQVAHTFIDPLVANGYDARLGLPFARGLVGLVAAAGQSWQEQRTLDKEELALQLVNLTWNGLLNLEVEPTYTPPERRDSDTR